MIVLNVVEITNDIPLYFGILFAAVFVIGLVIVIYEIITCNSDTRFCTGLVLGIIGLITGSILLAIAFATPPHKEYQVIIDKNTKFYELYDKYDVVKQEGYIYTLVDKEKENEQ